MGREREVSCFPPTPLSGLSMAGPRLLAMLFQGDELFHRQIGEACLS